MWAAGPTVPRVTSEEEVGDQETERWIAAGEPDDLAETQARTEETVCGSWTDMGNLSDAEMIAQLRNLAPLLVELWEAAQRFGEKPPRDIPVNLHTTYDGICKALTALEDA